MPSREEIDQYFEQEWKKARVRGDWHQTANEFWKCGEKLFWKLHSTWQHMADSFVTNRKRDLEKKESKSSSAKTKAHEVCVCTLCWRARAGANNEKRKEDDQVAECVCHTKATTNDLWLILDRCWRFVSLSFERVPFAFELSEQINRARVRITNHNGEEYEARVKEWFDAIGMEVANA